MKNKTFGCECPPPLNPAHQKLAEWFCTVRFPHTLLGGVDEAALWRKLEELHTLYDAALTAERSRYDALLHRQEESAHGS